MNIHTSYADEFGIWMFAKGHHDLEAIIPVAEERAKSHHHSHPLTLHAYHTHLRLVRMFDEEMMVWIESEPGRGAFPATIIEEKWPDQPHIPKATKQEPEKER